jgi:hypothetical protein
MISMPQSRARLLAHMYYICNSCRQGEVVSSEKNVFELNAGLPDFYWFKHTKREKCTKLPQTIPNGHKIYQMTLEYCKWS